MLSIDKNERINENFLQVITNMNAKLKSYDNQIKTNINLVSKSLINAKNSVEKADIKKEIIALRTNIETLQQSLESNKKLSDKIEDLVVESTNELKGQYVINNNENILPKGAIKRRVNEFKIISKSIKEFNSNLNEIKSKIGV